MVGGRVLERGTLSVYPFRGSQLSQRESQGRFAPYHVQQNTIHRNTQSTNVAGIYSLPYGGLSKNLPAKLQFAEMQHKANFLIKNSFDMAPEMCHS